MSGKIRNPTRRCKACGNKCSKRMRYCKLCAAEIHKERASTADQAEGAT